jgi:hypothetical protein
MDREFLVRLSAIRMAIEDPMGLSFREATDRYSATISSLLTIPSFPDSSDLVSLDRAVPPASESLSSIFEQGIASTRKFRRRAV